VKGPNIPHRRPAEKTAVFAIELADAFGFLREILLRAKVDGAPFAHLLPLLGDDVISTSGLVSWIQITSERSSSSGRNASIAIPEIINWGAATPQLGSCSFGQDVSGDLHQIELALGVFRLPRNPRNGIRKTPIRVAGRQVIGVCRVERLRGSL
jgi:hypothetical protein